MNEQQGLDPMFQENGSQWMEGGLASEPLNVYTAKTFGWMFLGLLVTFGTAIAFSAGGGLYYLLTMGMPAVFALAIAEIVVVMVLSARLHKLSIGAARGLFFAYAVLNGITFSAVFFAYDVQILLTVFALTSLYLACWQLRLVHQARPFRPASYPDGRADLPFGILAHLHVPAALRVRPHHLLCRPGRVHGPDGI
ncbi:MAG: Bax inhibitor-1 family protein [Ruthenibacterium lactatiformans]